MNQKEINTCCVRMHDLFHESIRNNPAYNIERLRYYTAWVYTWENENYVTYALKSYNTFIAIIVTDGERTGCYDFLRYAYGYTSTSCQHIRKFFSDYAGKDAEYFRYRPLKEAIVIFNDRG